MQVVIIGGVAAGMSAASKIKRMQPECKVTVFEKGRHISYGACGLPYYVGGFNEQPEKLIARTPEQFAGAGIEVKILHEVIALSAASKHLLVQDLQTSEVMRVQYDKLLISTGAAAAIPSIDGIDVKGVYFLKTMDDGLVLKEAVNSPRLEDVVVIGGGYIGVEMADALLHMGKKVTMIEAGRQILSSFEPELAQLARQELERNGVRVITGEAVAAIEATGGIVSGVRTEKGSYPAQMVICSVGILPATDFAKENGISLARNGAVIVDREMRTSVADIWAAGDCAVCYNKISGDNMFLPLGTVANKCGRIAGENMLGRHVKFVGALGSAAVKVCGLEMARTGLSERDAIQLGIDFKTMTVTAYDHPPYYPNPTPITIKLLYDKRTHVLLGAQAAGEKGAVLRLDVFAVAIHNQMSTDELGMADLVYAPPFAGVWDAVQIACNACK